MKQLKEILSYDPKTGHFTWLVSTGRGAHRKHPGYRAGGLKEGYRVIGIANEIFLEHRLAWFYMTGAWPSQIDHVNGIRDDNRWNNLRVATVSQNGWNRTKQSNSTTGLKGVSFHRNRYGNQWRAKLGKRELGYHASKESAYAAYCKAAAETCGEFARG